MCHPSGETADSDARFECILKALVQRNRGVDWGAVDDVILGCANQAGEDNRNIARMALLLADLPKEVSGTTVNRLCGSGLEAVAVAARAIDAGDAAKARAAMERVLGYTKFKLSNKKLANVAAERNRQRQD